MSEFLHFLSQGFLIRGAVIMLELTAYSFCVGLVGGVIIAAVLVARIPVLSGFVRLFVIVSRGTPVLLQLFFVFDVLPTTGLRISAFWTAVFVLGVNTSSYFSEIIRGAVTSLDAGQTLAARSIGMPPLTIARSIVGPQALRIAIPGLANQVVVLVLLTSLASVITVPELTLRSQELSSATFKVLPVFAAAGLMYLVVTSVVSAVQLVLEATLKTESRREPASALRRILSSTARLAVRGPRLHAGGLRAAVPEHAPQIEDDALDEPRTHLTESVFRQGRGLSERKDALGSDGDRGNATLRVKELTKSYGDRQVLKGIDVSIAEGEIVAVMGVSGCGKSTLLRAVAGLEAVDGGTVELDGKDFGRDINGRMLRGKELAQARRAARIGVVFQHFELFSHMTALDNVASPLRLAYGWSRSDARDRARTLLRAVGLDGRDGMYPKELSGGQQQRAAIARTLAISPRLMLLDEPTSALDPLMVHEVLLVLRGLANLGITMMVVTHELGFARDVADRICFMHDGSIVESGPPAQVLDAPEHLELRKFLRILER